MKRDIDAALADAFFSGVGPTSKQQTVGIAGTARHQSKQAANAWQGQPTT